MTTRTFGIVRRWKADTPGWALTHAFIPLAFAPGEVCQFDWSHEHVVLGAVMQTIKVAHFRLTFSRQMFVVAYPRETQEMVFDAHNRAFAFSGGVPQRMAYDNLQAVVEMNGWPPVAGSSHSANTRQRRSAQLPRASPMSSLRSGRSPRRSTVTSSVCCACRAPA